MNKTLLIITLVLCFAALGNTDCGKKTDKGATLPTGGLPLSKFCGQMRDFKTSKKGARVSSCGGAINAEFLETVDDACRARVETIKANFPAWNVGMSEAGCDILLLEPDGILTTIPDYPRPFLFVGGYNSAGTVLFSPARSIIVLPDFSVIQWGNRHYQFWSVYNEFEHKSGYDNRNNSPLNHWRNFLAFNDRHPQETPLEEWLPDYAKFAETDLAGQRPADVRTLAPYPLTPEQAEHLFTWLDAERAKLKGK